MRARRVDVEQVLPLRAAVLRPGLPMSAARFPLDDVAEHWVLEDGDHVVAVLSLMPAPCPDLPSFTVQLRGMAAAQPGGGAGALLLRHVQRAVARPLWCNARLRAVSFYRRHGWSEVSDQFEIVGVGPHYRMTWSPDADEHQRDPV